MAVIYWKGGLFLRVFNTSLQWCITKTFIHGWKTPLLPLVKKRERSLVAREVDIVSDDEPLVNKLSHRPKPMGCLYYTVCEWGCVCVLGRGEGAEIKYSPTPCRVHPLHPWMLLLEVTAPSNSLDQVPKETWDNTQAGTHIHTHSLYSNIHFPKHTDIKKQNNNFVLA